jgi:3D (Asp-Asp-Asp) domain-containing protein
MKQQSKSLSYYLASAAGFAIGFAGIIAPFAYYEVVKANDVVYESTHRFAFPTNSNLISTAVKLSIEEKISATSQNNANNVAVEITNQPKLNLVKGITETLPTPEAKLDLSKELVEKELVEQCPKDINRFTNRLRDGKKVKMVATAYCLNGRTASGVFSKYGIIAADPKYLPIGSIVKLQSDEYTGLYSVLDTGGKIKGRKIDIYLASGREAIEFGRRDVTLEVLRYGWNPQICNDIVLEEQKTLNVSIR